MTSSFPLRQRGFSLIEVLVSMFIVSLGILALAGLMQASARYGQTSELRSTATLLANDIADHIRANVGGTSAYVLGGSYSSTATPPTATNTCLSPTVCVPSDIAAIDLANWMNRVTKTLPGGDAYLAYNPPPAATTQGRGSVDVWVAWTDPVAGNERPANECAAGLGVASNPQVRCVYMQVGL